jgi:uncharacterized protein (TIGR02646 family)
MIRLELGSEPARLTQERTNRLPAAIQMLNARGLGHKDFTTLLDVGYQVAREELRERQRGKCAFCEKKEDAFKRPVEHFRPKKCAQDLNNGQWVEVNTHYWWLTWTWTNLYFSCDECNRIGHKGSCFPILQGSARIAPPTQPVPDPIPPAHYETSQERRLLVDPRYDDPLDHLQWTPVDRTKPKPIWQWTIDGRDSRGDMTIKVLGLLERVDEVNLHLSSIKLLWTQIEGHLTGGRQILAEQCWDDVVSTYVENQDQPFRNASWWALESLCPPSERLAHRLRDPPIPKVVYVAPVP